MPASSPEGMEAWDATVDRVLGLGSGIVSKLVPLQEILGRPISMNQPGGHASVSWSEENLIACCCNEHIVVLSASNAMHSDSGRVCQWVTAVPSVPAPEQGAHKVAKRGKKRGPTGDNSVQSAFLANTDRQMFGSLSVKYMTWSPYVSLGSSGAACLLGIVLQNGALFVMGPPGTARGEGAAHEQRILFDSRQTGVEWSGDTSTSRSEKRKSMSTSVPSPLGRALALAWTNTVDPTSLETHLILYLSLEASSDPASRVNGAISAFECDTSDEKLRLVCVGSFAESPAAWHLLSACSNHGQAHVLLSCTAQGDVMAWRTSMPPGGSDGVSAQPLLHLCCAVPCSVMCMDARLDPPEAREGQVLTLVLGMASGSLAHFRGAIAHHSGVAEEVNGPALENFIITERAHTALVSGAAIAAVADGQESVLVFSCGQDGEMFSWETGDGGKGEPLKPGSRNGLSSHDEPAGGLDVAQRLMRVLSAVHVPAIQCPRGGFRWGMCASPSGSGLACTIRRMGQLRNPNDLRFRSKQLSVVEVVQKYEGPGLKPRGAGRFGGAYLPPAAAFDCCLAAHALLLARGRGQSAGATLLALQGICAQPGVASVMSLRLLAVTIRHLLGILAVRDEQEWLLYDSLLKALNETELDIVGKALEGSAEVGLPRAIASGGDIFRVKATEGHTVLRCCRTLKLLPTLAEAPLLRCPACGRLGSATPADSPHPAALPLCLVCATPLSQHLSTEQLMFRLA